MRRVTLPYIANLPNPKQRRGANRPGTNWFPYYAGYSSEFVSHVLGATPGADEIRVLDPWNGAGTTTTAADRLGVSAWGFDLNPVMTLAARSRLLGENVSQSLDSLARDIVRNVEQTVKTVDDPLNTWLVAPSARSLRSLERSLHRILVDSASSPELPTSINVDTWSALAAFYYVALFKSAQELLKPFRTANPSWVTTPGHPSARLRPSMQDISKLFLQNVEQLILKRASNPSPSSSESRVTVQTGSATSLPLGDNSIDLVLGSPPYCTRLDYAVATRLELAVLGFGPTQFRSLRERLLGTTAIAPPHLTVDRNWGVACNKLLRAIDKHPSKGSHSYYWKNHVQYFDGLFRSLMEINRVMAPPGACTLVVQDSYYKNLHNDLPKIVTEMASSLGWQRLARNDFSARISMAALHASSPHRDSTWTPVESVLRFGSCAQT